MSTPPSPTRSVRSTLTLLSSQPNRTLFGLVKGSVSSYQSPVIRTIEDNSSEKQIEDLEANRAFVNELLNSVSKKLDEANAANDSMLKHIRDQDFQIQDLIEKLDSKEAAIKDAQDHKVNGDDMRGDITALRIDLQTKTQALSESTQARIQQSERIRALENELEETTVELQAISADLELAKSTIATSEEQKARMIKQGGVYSPRLESNTLLSEDQLSHIQDLTDELERLQYEGIEEIELKDILTEEFREQLRVAENEVQEARRQLLVRDTTFEQMKGKLKAAEEEAASRLADHYHKLGDKEAEIESQAELLTKLRKEIDAAQTHIETHIVATLEMKSKLAKAEAQKEDLESQAFRDQDELASLALEIKSLQTDLAAAHDKYTDDFAIRDHDAVMQESEILAKDDIIKVLQEQNATLLRENEEAKEENVKLQDKVSHPLTQDSKAKRKLIEALDKQVDELKASNDVKDKALRELQRELMAVGKGRKSTPPAATSSSRAKPQRPPAPPKPMHTPPTSCSSTNNSKSSKVAVSLKDVDSSTSKKSESPTCGLDETY